MLHRISHVQSLHRLGFFTCYHSAQSHVDLHAPAWLKSRSTLSAFRPETFAPHHRRAMSYTLQNLTPRTGTTSSISLPASRTTCEDRRPQLSGALTELPPPTGYEQPRFTGYEPNWIAEDRDYRHFTGDGQSTEHEEKRVRPLSFHQSISASTCDPAESIATPPESDLGDEELRALLVSPLYLQERDASTERSLFFITLNEKT